MNSVISAFTKTKKNTSNNSNNIGSSSGSVINGSGSGSIVALVDNNISSSGGGVGSSVGSNNTKPNGMIGGNTGNCATNSVSITKKKGGGSALNAQDNGYQYLRHIREIETANKLLSPVVVDADDLLESELLNFRPPSSASAAPAAAPSSGIDVVDHCVPATVRLTTTTATKDDDDERNNADYNMNGSCMKLSNSVGQQQAVLQCFENGNVDICCNENNTVGQQTNGLSSSPTLEVDDDEISEHSTAACTSTSSSEHSNSTVVHSPTVATTTTQQQQQQQQPSPAKSLSLSLSSTSSSSTHYAPSNGSTSSSASSSSSSSSTTSTSSVAITCGPRSTQSSTTTLSSLCSSNGGGSGEQLTITTTMSNGMTTLPAHSPTLTATIVEQNGGAADVDDYVPAFLKTTPITLPIIMSNNNTANARNLTQSSAASSASASSSTSAATTPKHARFTKPRLTLSRFINHSMPSVHGRPNLSVPPSEGCGSGGGVGGTASGGSAANVNGTNPPKRISTHQRNLSLDFRSMGIFLPPVSQVTNTRINHTQHHRNRSLDSALQRIPEVEVSSPNAESENTFCSPSSILGTNMCSKIVTTAANMTAALSTTTTPALTSGAQTEAAAAAAAAAATVASPPTLTSYIELVAPTAAAPVHHPHYPHPHPLHSLQHGPSVIVESCPTLRARPKSSESGARVQDLPGIIGTSNNSSSSATSSNSSGSSKKREDLTSLGSDDSGIICGSESDQISLNRIRQSHESLDSGEMDAEEECIDMLETNSMDEEYNLLQSDLCFYPPVSATETDCRTLRPSRKQKQQQQQQQMQQQLQQQQQLQHQQQEHDDSSGGESQGGSLDDRLRYRVMNMSLAAINMERGAAPNEIEPVMDDEDEDVTACGVVVGVEESVDVVDAAPTPTNATPTTMATTVTTPTAIVATTPTQATPTPTEASTKNDQVLFKNFFGATKNAIFRTAQSIIENHEKKNAAKQKNEQQQEGVDKTNANAANATTMPQDQVKSPTDISKKKEFFSLLTSNSSKKAAAAAAAAAASANASAANTPVATPTVEANGELMKSPNFDAAADTKHAENNERTLNLRLPGAAKDDIEFAGDAINTHASLAKSASISSLNKLKVPGVVKYFISDRALLNDTQLQKTEKGPSGLLRFFESPVFNIHFAVHYLFYSKEPGVLSFIGNKIFSFPDQEVDLYIPQLIVMYIQMDELAEVLDPYLTIRCRKSVDFSLKCLWLLEAYNYQIDSLGHSARKSKLALMKEIFSKKESKILSKNDVKDAGSTSATATLIKKTHHRSQSDATVLLTNSNSSHTLSISNRLYQQPPYTTQTLPPTPAKLCLGDLTSGRAFDNGCTCFESVRGQVNGLLGQKTFCSCGAPKTAPQKEFMKALINVGKNLTSLPSKAEKTSALRMFLNLINKNLPARVWLPLYSDIPHHVVRITEEKTAVLNSKDKTPYIIYVEVLEVPDIYSSPVITKMMPTLRHTKSEEHLEGACGQLNHASCSRTSSCSSHHNGSSCRRKKEKLNSESSSVISIDGQTNGGGVGVVGGGSGACGDGGHCLCNVNVLTLGGLHLSEDVWSQEDDEITAQYLNMRKISERDAISQMSLDSCDSRDQGPPIVFNIGDVRTRHCNNLNCENTKSFSNDPEDPSAAALKEPWHEKEQQIRESSPYGHLSNWRLLSAIVKCGDDLRQELMATQLLQMFKIIWQEEHVDLWVRPYKIVCLSNDSGLIEPILNTVSLHQIKKNSNKSLRDYFIDEYGAANGESFRRAQKNFVQSCAAYCLISYLLQVKDRHNGNILLHSDGHIIHIDFGFILSISPKNLGFEQSPFKLTPEFVDVMGGTSSEHWREFNRLLLIGMMSARKHMDRIINFVEIMRSNAQLPCFKNGCSGTVQNLRKRFHMNLTEQEMERKVEQLVQDSLKSLSTKLYDGYQYYTNGIL